VTAGLLAIRAVGSGCLMQILAVQARNPPPQFVDLVVATDIDASGERPFIRITLSGDVGCNPSNVLGVIWELNASAMQVEESKVLRSGEQTTPRCFVGGEEGSTTVVDVWRRCSAAMSESH
jgi:hypothetical protein